MLILITVLSLIGIYAQGGSAHTCIPPPAPNWSNGTATGYYDPRVPELRNVLNLYASLCVGGNITYRGRVYPAGSDRSQHFFAVKNTVVIHAWCGEGIKNDTLQCLYSAGKGVFNAILAHAEGEELFDWDDRVAKKRPSFAQNGKSDITIADVASNRAGLHIVNPFNWNDTHIGLNEAPVFHAIDTTTPTHGKVRKPGCYLNIPRCFTYNVTYNPVNKGQIVKAIMQSVDPYHRDMWDYFQQEIIEKMNDPYAEFHLGIAPNDTTTLARFALVNPGFVQPVLNPGVNMYFEELYTPGTDQFKSAFNPIFLYSSGLGPYYPDSEEGRNSELWSSNIFCPAYSLGLYYMGLANKGVFRGQRIWTEEAIRKAARIVFSGPDYLQFVNFTFTQAGFVQNFPTYENADNNHTIAHPGLAGSNGYANMDDAISHAYVTSNYNTGSDEHWMPPAEWMVNDAFNRVFQEHKALFETFA